MKPSAILEAAMADLYRVFGAGISPSSVKVCAYFRYKAAPHQWILRKARRRPGQGHARPYSGGGRLPCGIAGIDDQFLT